MKKINYSSGFLLFFLNIFSFYLAFTPAWAQQTNPKTNTPAATITTDSRGALYIAPEPVVSSQSRITFYRPTTATWSGVYSIKINGNYLASLQSGSYVDLCLTPMQVEFNAYPVETSKPLKTQYAKAATNLAPGKDLYVRVVGQDTTQDVLTMVNAELAQAELQETRRQIHTISRIPGVVECQVMVAAKPAKTAPETMPSNLEIKEVVNLETDKYFEFSKSDISGMLPESLNELNNLVQNMKRKLDASPTSRLKIVGYSDPMGKPQRKKLIAAERAKAVKNYMVRMGISARRILSEGRADADLVISNCSAEKSIESIACNKPNRRVAIQLYDVK
jgi:outer membrane protein OmpA-like peptidoglycan-associated protein